MKEKIVLVLSILVGLAAFWLTNRYLEAEREKLFEGAEKIRVVVAGRDLPAGGVLAVEDLAQKSVYKTAVGENVVRPEDVGTIVDKRLRYSLREGEPVWWSYVDVPDRRRAGLAPMIKSGLRAVSISLGGSDTVSGLVQPNDRVDILGTFTFPGRGPGGEQETVTLTVLQDVTVLATGQQLARTEPGSPQTGWRPGGYSTVTLEVTPREAELLTFIQHMKGQGQLTLTLRNPEDVGFESLLPEVNFQHLETNLGDLNLYRQRYIRHKTNP